MNMCTCMYAHVPMYVCTCTYVHVYIQRYCDAIEKVSENKFVCSELAKTVFIEFGILTFFSVVKWSMSFVSFWKNSFCGRFTGKIKVAIFEFSSVTWKKTHGK
jgi:hypothetical protein